MLIHKQFKKSSFGIVNGNVFSIYLFLEPSTPTGRGRGCIARSCNLSIIGRSLTYGRALAIILGEEYLQEVSYNLDILEILQHTYTVKRCNQECN
jgi:hypothetical protein